MANVTRCLWEMRETCDVLASHPFYLRVCVSELCNLRCPGCLLAQGPVPSDSSRPRLMRLDDFRVAVRDFLPHLLKVNLYDEGEPLLNPAVFDMVRHLRDHRVGTCISSNFSMPLDDDRLHELIDSDLDHLIVCVDGATQETYSRYRAGGNLQRVLANLRRLVALVRARGGGLPNIELQFIEFDHNRHEKSRVAALAQEIGVWRFVVIQGSDPIGWRGTNFHGTEAERRRRGCYQLWVGAHVNVDGSLGTCDYGEDHGIENVGFARDYAGANLRNHPRLVELRRDFRSRATGMHEVCRSCSLYRRV
jgi:MoaA/NifB/PqqE/SkfB family radical SAM enzyme